MRTYFIPNARFWVLLILLLVLVFPTIALAQDTSAPLPPIPVMSMDDAAQLFVAAIISVIVGLVDSPITAMGVAALKHIPLLDPLPSKTLQFIVAGIITAAYWAASYLGYGAQFNTAAGFLLAIAPAMTGLLTRQVASSFVYKVGKNADIGLLSYQRPPERVAANRARLHAQG